MIRRHNCPENNKKYPTLPTHRPGRCVPSSIVSCQCRQSLLCSPPRVSPVSCNEPPSTRPGPRPCGQLPSVQVRSKPRNLDHDTTRVHLRTNHPSRLTGTCLPICGVPSGSSVLKLPSPSLMRRRRSQRCSFNTLHELHGYHHKKQPPPASFSAPSSGSTFWR